MQFLFDPCCRHRSLQINETQVNLMRLVGLLAFSAANQWACGCSVSGRYCSDFSGIRLNVCVTQKSGETVFSNARPLIWVCYLQLIRVPEKSKVILYSAPCSLAKTHKNAKDLTVWLEEIIYSYTRSGDLLYFGQEICAFFFLYGCLKQCVSSWNTCLGTWFG